MEFIELKFCFVSLHDVLHSEKKLTLIFEYADTDLKKYIEEILELNYMIIKVRLLIFFNTNAGNSFVAHHLPIIQGN